MISDIMFSLYKFATAFWAGFMMFLLFGVAQPLFNSPQLSRKMAGIAMQQIFPVYYLFGYLCAAVAVISLLFARRQAVRFWAALTCVLVALAGFATNDCFIGQKLDSLRDNANKESFQYWHGLSMSVNLLALIAVVVGYMCLGHKLSQQWGNAEKKPGCEQR